jgi:hypothetical protein
VAIAWSLNGKLLLAANIGHPVTPMIFPSLSTRMCSLLIVLSSGAACTLLNDEKPRSCALGCILGAVKFCPKCGAYWEDIEASCKRCSALLAASGIVDSTPRLNRAFVKILAFLCVACGLVAAAMGFFTGAFAAGLAGMMRDPSLGFLIILFPVAAGLPFFIVGFFLFRFRPWARRVLVVLLTLPLIPLAVMLAEELGGLDGSASLEIAAPFTFLAAVLVLTVSPMTRRAFGQPAGLWWLEAGLAALPVLVVFSTNLRETISIRQEVETGTKQQERDTEFIRLLQAPESQETDARLGQLISAGVNVHANGAGEMSPITLAAKNHPQVFKALLNRGAGPLEPIVWKYLADGGHFDLLPDVARSRIQLDPMIREQLGVELIRIIREGGNDPGYRERVDGLIQGGADLTVIDQDRTALDEAMRSGQTDIEDRLREKMILPARSQLLYRGDEVEVRPRIYDVQQLGPCPRTIVFDAQFTLNRRETVLYRFIDETTLALPDTQEFKADVGRNIVSLKRVIGGPGQGVSGWVQFELFAGKLHLTTDRSPFTVDCR